MLQLELTSPMFIFSMLNGKYLCQLNAALKLRFQQKNCSTKFVEQHIQGLVKSYCCNSCLKGHYGKCMTRHSISGNDVCWFIMSTRCFCIFVFPVFQISARLCSWMIYTLPPSSCLLPTHSLPSPWLHEGLFLWPFAFPLVHTVRPSISWKLQ